MTDHEYMELALNEAYLAGERGDVPVGAVLVMDGEVIARAGNRTREANNPVRHAEIEVIEEAVRFLNNERLTDSVIYVTKEPCAMCAGALVHARVARVVIGARDIKYGACGTVFNVCGNRLMNHVPVIEFDVLGETSAQLLKNFFEQRRK